MTQKPILLLLLVISAIVVLLNDVLLSEVPKVWAYGDRIGQVLSNLSLAYISSYIFYYVVVVIRERADKRNIYKRVYDLTKRLAEK